MKNPKVSKAMADRVLFEVRGTEHNSGGLVPEVGDVIRNFHGWMGEPITVRVVSVEQFGDGCVAFQVVVADHSETAPHAC